MNVHLENIKALLQSLGLPEEETLALQKALVDADKQWSSSEFKLNQSENEKKTTAILLEDTLAELEEKRTVVEAQNRELAIAAALERVRARAMSMQISEELNALVGTLFTELTKLDFVLTRCTIMIHDPATNDTRWLMANSEAPDKPMSYTVQYHKHRPNLAYLKAWQERTVKWVYVLQGETKKEWDDFLFSATELSSLPDFVIAGMRAPDKVYLNVSFANFGNLTLASLEPLSEEHFNILIRFATVFDLTYTRFNDLKQAEIQAREAQIQLALERVRAKTMAMQKPSEFVEVINVIGEQFINLGFEFDWVNFSANGHDVSKAIDIWNFVVVPGVYQAATRLVIPYFEHPVFTKAEESVAEYLEHGNEFTLVLLDKEEKDRFLDHLFTNTIYKDLPDDVKVNHYNQEVYLTSSVVLKDTWLSIGTYKKKFLTEEQISIEKRLAREFGQAYTRFLDLQKAEAQAREATIEAALEKVRGKAMAMHDSSDLSATASLVFTELRRLGISPIRCGVGLLNKESKKAQLYSATSTASGDHLSLVGWVQLEGHPVLENIYDSWLQQADYFPELQGEQLQRYYELLLAGLSVPVPDFTGEQNQYGHFIQFSIGCLYAWSDVKYNDDEMAILKRFAAIVDLTFRRYLELRRSETAAKEALKQAAMDRVRADIASMRTVDDLNRIIPLIWNELTILGVSFIRCGVFIMDDSQKLVHTFLSTPEGKAIAAFHLPYDTPGNFSQIVQNWRNKKIYIAHWTETDFTSLAAILVRQSAVATKEQYLNALPEGGFYLHFVPFQQGMLYVGNTTELGGEDLRLLEAVADAFSTAYARYEDFTKLENAKQQIELALSELRATQAQLIQSEKMASLGELTAGIAHEIQNPLNFVNNFSEVSNELLDEMLEEVAKENYKEVKAIAGDVKQNLEKINYHGKRADGIVKGMLQHSRASSGLKELTDINALTDEYLRLAYHGLRAKDKSFNAALQTDFDETIEKINLVPQDIGRVILNLITNAFYAVGEKQKGETKEYKPTVSVSTKKIDDWIEISVSDNGAGIPQAIVDKIFQPFFTTKPTGQGTGLGLSLAYDIIKAHGGELRVDTQEDRGSDFKMYLPLMNR